MSAIVDTNGQLLGEAQDKGSPSLATPNALVQLGTLQANTPKALVEGATEIANTLAQIIRSRQLASNIQGREYVRVEGWTVLGALLGVIAREESVIEREDGSYLATVALVRMADHVVVSRASAECNMDEPTWAKRAKYTRRSMALTRATGKAARLAFSWIMALAGFEPTPLEEMPTEPETGKNDAKLAQDYARRFNEAFELGLDDAVIDLCAELKPHQELHVAVWGYLPAGMRRQIKDLLARAQPESEAGVRG